ncbi:MAG: 30S ribosomal protein S12 methylthiotransferase RimO [Clostridiales bacterium]
MKYTIALCSLGCAKNLVDSERMLAILKNHNYKIIADFTAADVIVVNTCGFIESAKEESIETILEYAALKNNKCKVLVVTGCLVQKYQKDLAVEIPEVDLWLGTLNFTEIGEKLDELLPNTAQIIEYDDLCHRELTTPNHWAYLKIAEGCDNTCTFCVIPQMRGPYKSRTIENIIEELRVLISKGVKEVIVLAQDTTVYGKDIYGKPYLKELLKAMVKEDIFWIRILYSYPQRMDGELLELISREEKICTYLDIPMQHSEDGVLKAMGRPERKDKLIKLLKQIRTINADFVIRSTFIVGFPGETQEDFMGLCEFLQEAKLDWVGVFPYSKEEDTVAGAMPNQIPEDIKEYRYNYIMSLLTRYSAHNLEKWQNKTILVIIEGKLDVNDEYSKGYQYVARASFQAPDVDGMVYVKTNKSHNPGDAIKVTVVSTDIYDLMGEEI